MLPHNRIKEALGNIFRKVFTRESKTYINVNQHKAYFSKQNSRGFTSFREKDLNKILLFILENIYVRFGNKVAKQKIGIPIGLDSGQDIANLLLYFYESEYILQLSRVNLLEAKDFVIVIVTLMICLLLIFQTFPTIWLGFTHRS